MKRCFYVLLTLIVFSGVSCKSGKNDAEPAVQAAVQDTLIDFVKRRSQPREQFGNLLKMHWNRMPRLEIQEIASIMGRSLSNNDTIPLDTAIRYSILDFRELEHLFLFSIGAHKTDSSYTELYHFSLDTRTKQLFGCTVIGKSFRSKTASYTSKLSYATDGQSLIVNSKGEKPAATKGDLLIDRKSERFDFGEKGTWYRLLHEAHKTSAEIQ